MEIVVTGLSGFVSQYLQTNMQIKNKYVFPISVRESEWWEKIPKTTSVIIHLAGKAHDTSNSSEPNEYFIVNRDLTKEVFNYFLSSEVEDFIFFSSVKAVTDKVDGELTEANSPNPTTPYGISKFEAEQYLLSQKLPEGKRLFIIRPAMIHGPGNKGNLNLLFDVVKKGIPWPLGSFENQRSFLSIDNLVFLLVQMIENKDLSSGIYNFSDDKSMSTNELVRLISQMLGKKPKILKINKIILLKIAILGNYLSLPLNSERLKKLTESYVVSNKKIKESLGINELPVSAEEGLEKTIQSFITNIN